MLHPWVDADIIGFGCGDKDTKISEDVQYSTKYELNDFNSTVSYHSVKTVHSSFERFALFIKYNAEGQGSSRNKEAAGTVQYHTLPQPLNLDASFPRNWDCSQSARIDRRRTIASQHDTQKWNCTTPITKQNIHFPKLVGTILSYYTFFPSSKWRRIWKIHTLTTVLSQRTIASIFFHKLLLSSNSKSSPLSSSQNTIDLPPQHNVRHVSVLLHLVFINVLVSLIWSDCYRNINTTYQGLHACGNSCLLVYQWRIGTFLG